MIHHRPEFPARIMTITLQGAAVPFARTLRFNPDLPCGDLMNRICVALGRYPAPGAVVHRDGAYTGHDGAHFPHPDLDESPLCGTLPAGPDSFEFVLDRLRGWVFDVRVREEHDHPVPLSEDVEADEGPLLPRPAMSLTEYNAVMRARGGEYLPPDVERAVAEDGLFDLMDPEVAAPPGDDGALHGGGAPRAAVRIAGRRTAHAGEAGPAGSDEVDPAGRRR